MKRVNPFHSVDGHKGFRAADVPLTLLKVPEAPKTHDRPKALYAPHPGDPAPPTVLLPITVLKSEHAPTAQVGRPT